MTQPKWKIHHCEKPEEWALSRKKYEAAAAQHQASREALEFLLKDYGHSVASHQIKLHQFSKVESVDELVVSLSHTSPNLAAAVAGKTEIFKSVGIDLEKSDRKMKINSGHHFLNEGDDPELHTDLLRGWCKKEAAFKAWAPFWDQDQKGKPLVLKDLDIRGKHFYKSGSDVELGFVELIETEYLGQGLYLTLAWTLT
jgi:phosphopantetheinyl transferase (holo-ACP synthase)